MVAPIILAMYIYTQPESPRWLLAKAHKADREAKSKEYYRRVFRSLTALRHTKLQAARDMILIDERLLKEDELLVHARHESRWYETGLYELFQKRRNRRAVTASLIVMYMQQFCGINVLIYYSTSVLRDANLSEKSARNALLVGCSFNFTTRPKQSF